MEDKTFMLAVVVLLMAAGAASFGISSMLVDSAEKKLVSSGHEAWPPVMYHDGNGSIIGTGPEIIEKALADEYVIDSRYEGSWDQVHEKAKSGEVDIIVAVYKTEERQKYLLYTDPYMKDPIGIFVTSESLLSLSLEDILSSKEGIVTKGDSYGAQIDELLLKEETKLVFANNPEEAKEMLLSGKGDYFLYATFSGEKLFKDELSNNEVYTSTVGNELFYIGVSKANPDGGKIVQLLNKYIRENNLLT
ncbi:MAG TPA: transporter substrate-binding domain-containing protein [Candidatus Pacearchaeota archaeon]|nr:transporter substrate-binding domain-containing protein [Candidatus Pacearchaeota archaeon]